MAEPLDLHVNGASETLAVATIADLLDAKGVDAARKGIAVALNGTVVPRARWAEQTLASGDTLEIIQARQGG
ncbi:sulfur carrier protein ThiS [Aquabacter spiritensis]|uniref:Sulfur carrier protein n=1 Tax=Aquabacter spiritensis TaxID=933073 RepID=A0A4R3LXB9_9HYPH|nr:sulfur carrier protein ThiS [Aquabacter spiritensis]TCT03227.1 sulfur carrier protein [Aquabacter spiritensis]